MTIISIFWYVRFIEVLTLVFASALIILAYKSYKKNKSQSMLLASFGFSFLGIASLVEGIMFDVLKFPLPESHAVRSTITALGFLILLYSIHKTK